MSEPITNVEDAVRELGALPMPTGPDPLTEEALSQIAEVARQAYEYTPGVGEAWDWLAGYAVPTLVAELRQARARVAEQDAQREALAERLRAGQRWQRGRRPELVSENLVSQSELRDIFGIPLVTPWANDYPAETGGAS